MLWVFCFCFSTCGCTQIPLPVMRQLVVDTQSRQEGSSIPPTYKKKFTRCDIFSLSLQKEKKKMAHLAFQRHPTQHVGVLRDDTMAPLLLHGVMVNVEIRDTTARVQVTYEYRNATGAPCRAFSAFPRVPGWTLVRLSAKNGDRRVQTLVGSDPSNSLALPPQSDTFVSEVVTQAIPWAVAVLESVSVSALYYAPLVVEGTADFILTLPRTLFPRAEDVPQEYREYNAKFDCRYPVTLARSVYVSVKGTLMDPVAETPVLVGNGTKSQGHSAGNTFDVKWEEMASGLDVAEDLVMRIRVAPSNDPQKLTLWKDVAANRDQSAVLPAYTHAGTVSITPKFTAEQLTTVNDEVIFLVDASASMAPYWADVLRALKIATASLPPTTYVNLVWFHETPEYLFPDGSELLSQAVRDHMVEDVLGFQLRTPSTSKGKLYQAIQSLYKQPYITGFVRNIVLITDSGAEDHLSARVVEIARANTHSTRLSTVAVGPVADVEFLELLSKESNGVAARATSSSACSVTIASVLNAVHVPTLVQVVARTEYDSSSDTDLPPVEIWYPKIHLPCIPLGQRVFLPYFGSAGLKPFTFVTSGMLGLHHLDYKTQCPDIRSLQDQSMTEEGKPETSSILHVAAALQLVQKLCSDNDHSALTDAEKRKVRDVSVSFFVPSPVTACVSSSHLDQTPRVSTAICSLRYIAPRVVRQETIRQQQKRRAFARDGTGARKVDADDTCRPAVLAEQNALGERQLIPFLKDVVVSEVVRRTIGGNSASEAIADVLLSQNADGSFRSGSLLQSGLGLSTEYVASRAPADTTADLWNTAVAVAVLKQRGEDDPQVSALVQRPLSNGRLFLQAQHAESLLTTAARVLVK